MENTIIRTSLIILSILLLGFTGCNAIIPRVPRVELNKDYSVLLIGETDQLEASIVNGHGTGQNLIWASNDPGIATVSETGLVTGVSTGTTQIIATLDSSDRNATCQVTVAPMTSASGIKIVPATTVTILKGQTFQYTATVSPSNAVNIDVTWSSSNPNVATISENGLVTAIADGWTIISAKSEDGGFTSGGRLDVISTEIPVTGIDLGADIGHLGELAPTQLSFSIFPSNAANKNVFWASSNPRIATISQSGLATPLQFGDVEIVVMTEDGAFTDRMTLSLSPGPHIDPLKTKAQQR